MFYITGWETNDGVVTYYLVDRLTTAIVRLRSGVIVNKVNKGLLEIMNADIVNGEISLHEWVKHMEMTDTIVMTIIDDRIYKIYRGSQSVEYIDKRELDTFKVINNIDGEYKDTVHIEQDFEFKEQIEDKYRQFLAKTKMLGVDVRFEYNVEGTEVIINNYVGDSKNVIIPNFVTIIKSYALACLELDSISVGGSIKRIGAFSFSGNNVEYIRLPKTLEFMCISAVMNKNYTAYTYEDILNNTEFDGDTESILIY